MPKYNHAFSVGFSLENDLPDGHDTPLEQLIAGMTKRLRDLQAEDPNAAREAFDCFDTYEVEENENA